MPIPLPIGDPAWRSAAPDKRPIAVGDIIHGFCHGLFGRDHYHCVIVEAVGVDWVVTRSLENHGIEMVSGFEDIKEMRKYRIRTSWPNGTSPCCNYEE